MSLFEGQTEPIFKQGWRTACHGGLVVVGVLVWINCPALCILKDLTVTAEIGKLLFKTQTRVDSCPSLSTSLHTFFTGDWIKGSRVCVCGVHTRCSVFLHLSCHPGYFRPNYIPPSLTVILTATEYIIWTFLGGCCCVLHVNIVLCFFAPVCIDVCLVLRNTFSLVRH